MAGKIDICSMALASIGCDGAVDLDNPTKEEERLCILFWDQTVKELLEEHDWKFARAYKVLDGSLALSSSPSDEYDYAYQLPNDCLILRYLWDTDAGARVTDSEYELQGRSILTDLEAINIVYTKHHQDIGNYPAFFVSALVPLLASRLAPKLASKEASTQDLDAKYERALRKAIDRDNSQNNYPIETDNDSWVAAGGYSELGAAASISDDSTVIYVQAD